MAKKRLALKLNNPRLLKITFTTFRHWKGTMEYHRTHDLLHVKKLLGARAKVRLPVYREKAQIYVATFRQTML